MKLKELFVDIPLLRIEGSLEVEITGLANNSKQVMPGDLFFAKRGLTQSGADFCKEAAFLGAAAIVGESFDPLLKGGSKLIVSDVSYVESLVAKRFYEDPSSKLCLVGITGTNGKTTCSYLVKYLFDSLALPCGLIGTIEWIIQDKKFPSKHTTPDVMTNQKLLQQMVSSGCKASVMEVSSHGLDQGRVQGLDFSIGVFTNLTQDHLDYHKTMKDYGEAKAKLFSSLGKDKIAIINKDSPWADFMVEGACCSILTYGFSKEADLYVEEISLSAEGMSCFICYREKRVFFLSRLVGKFNLYNLMAAALVGISVGVELEKVLEILSSFSAVPGRLERVFGNVFVDYAHTEDALQNTLSTLREISKGRLLCVFGCGGDRDKDKRPKMGAVAASYCDEVFITSDNPRGEAPETIIEQILAGVSSRDKVRVEVDRRKAIKKAVGSLKEEDVLLIAGKGHENMQVFADHTLHFDDRIVAKEYCK